jgi:hypothetical protein
VQQNSSSSLQLKSQHQVAVRPGPLVELSRITRPLCSTASTGRGYLTGKVVLGVATCYQQVYSDIC